MGHERIGILPRRRRWIQVVEGIGAAAISAEGTGFLAARVLKNVSGRFSKIPMDSGVQAAFGFLVGLAASSKTQAKTSHYVPETDLDDNPSSLRLASVLREWVEDHSQSTEYASIAIAAAADTIVGWTKQVETQPSLFRDRDTAHEIWNKASSSGGFSEVTRLFLAKFTERYLNYFLEREASAELQSLHERRLFSSHLRDHVSKVSCHAFETSKIAQSFAAGWYNRHLKNQIPGDDEIRGFLGLCFSKLREELLRELPR
jgi:hypothetical protein